jgi:hypothetical protein
VLRALPASARLWFGDLRDRARAAAVEAYTSAHESPALLAAELGAIRRGGGGGDGGKFTVRTSAAAREVIAQLEIEDGASLDLLIKLPASTPLRAAEVECRNKVGVMAAALCVYVRACVRTCTLLCVSVSECVCARARVCVCV